MADSGIQLNTLDPRSLDALKRMAHNSGNSDESLRATSRQIESLFLHMMLKAMRNASMGGDPFESEQTRLARDLYDQQLASNLAHSRGGTGLATAIYRQLGGGTSDAAASGATGATGATGSTGSTGSTDATAIIVRERTARHAGAQRALRPGIADTSAANVTTNPTTAESAALSEKIASTVEAARKAGSKVPQHVREFVNNVWPHAHAASQATGIPAHFMVAQAALETGWGARQPKNADGTPSHNLFNIKGGGRWAGATTAHHTVTEYDGTGWQRQKATFRSYASYAEAFADYAHLLKASPRYSALLGTSDAASFAQGLQEAGYATDPMYADKLLRIIGGNTLKNALAATVA
ncbi:MAG: flagellar assembly peptidoglycan hydrolase FlgJ [Azoarcus sp.]|jgi:flagellar protein FlgJ|nr:flagellar assembly peptidoglycan hydrolase FlgJ [Azoarcus sp.]